MVPAGVAEGRQLIEVMEVDQTSHAAQAIVVIRSLLRRLKHVKRFDGDLAIALCLDLQFMCASYEHQGDETGEDLFSHLHSCCVESARVGFPPFQHIAIEFRHAAVRALISWLKRHVNIAISLQEQRHIYQCGTDDQMF
jgi:hypothetical protein